MALLELKLLDGRRIWAAELHAEATYAHVLEGRPNHKSNDRYLANFPERLKRIFNGAFPVYLIEPDRKVEEGTGGTSSRGPTEYLPPYWYAAEFYDNSMNRCLAVVWFQQEPLPMPSESICQKISAIDWDTHAEEFIP